MKFYKLGMVAVMSTLLLSACSGTGGRTGWYDQWGSCAAVGAGVGMAAGATDDFDAIGRRSRWFRCRWCNMCNE